MKPHTERTAEIERVELSRGLGAQKVTESHDSFASRLIHYSCP